MLSNQKVYPRQLITSLAERVNQKLYDFFNIEYHKYFKDYKDFNFLISDTLWEYIQDKTSKSELQAIYSTQIRMRRQKKKRWFSTFQKNQMLPINERKNPFFFIQEHFNKLSGHDFVKLYEVQSVAKVIDIYKNDIEYWITNQDLLIEYPFLSCKTSKQILMTFKIDLIINLIGIIMDFFDGNIESFFAKKPEILLNSPFFAPNRFSLPIPLNNTLELLYQEADDLIFQVMFNQQTITLNASTETKSNAKFQVFDTKDLQLLITLINNINIDFYESRQVVMTLGSLARSLYKKPNAQQYEDVIVRLNNMATMFFRGVKKSNPSIPVFTFAFFDNVLIQNRNDKIFAIVTFGKTLYESVTKDKMISVTYKNYNSLKLELSKLLYHKLQQERITLSASSNKSGCFYKSYNYSFFQNIILFKKNKRTANIELIESALEEFKEKRIAIKTYDYDKSTGLFNLYYYPLTVDEKIDLGIIKEEEMISQKE